MSILWEKFHDKFEVASFGWGTNLTNDLGPSPLSIVIKPDAVKVGGEWIKCAKLSDDITKATRDPDVIAQLSKAVINGAVPPNN